MGASRTSVGAHTVVRRVVADHCLAPGERMQIRRAYADRDTGAPLVSIDSDALGGISTSIIEDPDGDLLGIDVHIDDQVTGQLPSGRWFFDVELVRIADQYVRRLVRGRAQVVPEVTR